MMKEVYKDGQQGFCPRCFEPSEYKGFQRPDGRMGGFWWHVTVGIPEFCAATNWPEGIVSDPAVAERGKVKLLARARGDYEKSMNSRTRRSAPLVSQPAIPQTVAQPATQTPTPKP